MIKTWEATSCNHTSFDSAATIECLRSLSAKELLLAQESASSGSASNNIGDQWLPVVDGDFLPDAPSTLVYEKKFASVNTIIGWCEDDAMLFTPYTIKTPADTATFVSNYLPALTKPHLKTLLSLYPSNEFSAAHFPNGTIERTAEQYRLGRIIRDILFTCQPIFYGQAIAASGSKVYFYNQNQTAFTTEFDSLLGALGDGVFHGSEQPYVFGNLTVYPGILSDAPSDIRLRNRESRSWSTFTALGHPSLAGHDTLRGWLPADFGDENYGAYVIGGPNEGDSGPANPSSKARAAMAKERLAERCGFLTSRSIVKEEQF
jgi:carboxylesterase type B